MTKEGYMNILALDENGEKKAYNDQDFIKRVKNQSGELPKNLKEADIWWEKSLKIWSAWLLRYENNSMEVYAKLVLNKYVDRIEEQYKKLVRLSRGIAE